MYKENELVSIEYLMNSQSHNTHAFLNQSLGHVFDDIIVLATLAFIA